MIKSAVMLVSAVIGAAFASGKEIQVFFNQSNNPALSLTVSAILFLIVPAIIYLQLMKYNSSNFSDFIKVKFKSFAKYIMIISIILTLCIYCAMVNGANVILPKYGGTFLIILTVIILIFDLKGIETLSALSTPLLIVGISLNCYLTISVSTFQSIKTYSYSLYNILSAFPLMCSFRKYFKNKKNAVFSSIISGAVLSALLVAIFYCLPEISHPMPMLDLANSNSIELFYKIVIYVAIFTTAVTSGKGFVESVKINRKHSITILAVCGLVLSLLGFNNIIEILTNVFGVVGTIIITYIVFSR